MLKNEASRRNEENKIVGNHRPVNRNILMCSAKNVRDSVFAKKIFYNDTCENRRGASSTGRKTGNVNVVRIIF